MHPAVVPLPRYGALRPPELGSVAPRLQAHSDANDRWPVKVSSAEGMKMRHFCHTPHRATPSRRRSNQSKTFAWKMRDVAGILLLVMCLFLWW